MGVTKVGKVVDEYAHDFYLCMPTLRCNGSTIIYVMRREDDQIVVTK